MNQQGVNYISLTIDGWVEDDEGNWTYYDGVTSWSSEAPSWGVAWAGGGFGPAYLAGVMGGSGGLGGSGGVFFNQASELTQGLSFQDGQWTPTQ